MVVNNLKWFGDFYFCLWLYEKNDNKNTNKRLIKDGYVVCFNLLSRKKFPGLTNKGTNTNSTYAGVGYYNLR